MHVEKVLTYIYVLFGNERKSKCKQKDFYRIYIGYSRKNTYKYFASHQIMISYSALYGKKIVLSDHSTINARSETCKA